MTGLPTSPGREHWPSLDGLRGVAILLVTLAHSGLILAPIGGQVGVTLFFVLSGFLITTILAAEKSETGGVSLRRFYGRRARRLLPALLFFLAVSGVILFLVIPDFPWWASSWPGLLYVSNYSQILGVDSFANAHLWSLSVEEHFYAFWPLALITIPAVSKPRTIALLAGASFGLRILIGLFDPFWAYHGTITNAGSIMLGCYVALARRDKPLPSLRYFSPAIGVAILVLLSTWTATSKEHLLHLGVWLPVVAAFVAVLTIAVSLDHRGGFLRAAWLRYVGKVSYAWYLWHAPFLFIARFNDTPSKRLFFTLATFLMATFSWRFVERPFLRYRSRQTLRETHGEIPSAGLRQTDL